MLNVERKVSHSVVAVWTVVEVVGVGGAKAVKHDMNLI